ncbi:MAG: hypothetical protein HZC11_08030 [Nitrospirae bacterium]|nr:hypothetical protein [Nitrospirota bacterium]
MQISNNYLKNIFPRYIASGIVLSLLIFSAITLHKYTNYLNDTLGTLKNITANKNRVNDQINKMDAWLKYLNEELKSGAPGIYSEKTFFQTLDSLKINMKDASITITRFEETGEEKRLPVEIVIPVKNYKTIVDYIGYLESLRMPHYKINRFYVSRVSAGNVVLNIQGVLRLPVLKAEK